LDENFVFSIDRNTTSNTQSGGLEVEGIALVGNATVGWFTDLKKTAAEQIRRTFASALVRAERAEITARASAPDASVERRAARFVARSGRPSGRHTNCPDRSSE
jgi:hypothetical protein